MKECACGFEGQVGSGPVEVEESRGSWALGMENAERGFGVHRPGRAVGTGG